MVSDANFFDLTETQRKLLQKTYEKIQQPDAPILEQLVGLTGLNVRIVRAWFQNERKKEKKALKVVYKKQEKLKKKAHKKQQQTMKEKQVISDSSYSDLSCHGGSSSETSSDAYSSSSSGSEGEEDDEVVTDSSEEEADEEWRAKKKAKEEKENPMKTAENSMMKMLNENPQKTAIQKQQMMMGKLKINAENMMDDYWQMNQQQPQQRKKDANATKATANGAHILPMPNAPPLTPSVASTSTSSTSQLNPRGFGQGLFSGQQQKSTETKGKMDKQVPMPSNQRHNIDGAGWKWRLLKILGCIFVCILIQLFYSAKLKPQQKNVLNGKIKMINRTFSNSNRKSSCDNGKMAKNEAAIVAPTYSSYYPEFPEALFLQNDYSDFLQILPIFEEIQMDPVNFTTLLDSDQLEVSKKHGKLAGFEWELAMLKSRQNLLFLVISAKNANSNARKDYNVTGEIEFYINLEYPDIGIAPNCGKEEEAQFRHKRHCIFNSLEGGKCGLLMANPERHLRRFFVGQQSQSLLAQIGVLLHLNVPPQKEAIEHL